MRTIFFLLTVTFVLLPRLIKAEWVSDSNLQLDQSSGGTINMPVSGQLAQGVVIIRGNASMPGFVSYEVDFAYASDPTQTWFLVQESTLSIQEGILAVWDTSTITDGNYNLRLVINRAESDQEIMEITGLRVRNYTPVETETPAPTLAVVTLVQGVPTLTTTSRATSILMATSLPPPSTPLPANPAEVTSSQVLLTFSKGAAITIGIFTILGTYIGIMSFINKHK
jgi:hypothetical protein